MSLGIFSVYSHTLGMDVPLNVMLPERRKQAPADWSDRRFPVLYCLHGHSDDQYAWLRKSQIELVTRNLEVIVVMPTTHRGFYTDEKHGPRYFSFLADELPQLVANMFHASTAREDTFVMGNSMGGYGAFKLALARPDRYAAAASLSGALEPMACMSSADNDALFNMDDFTANIRNVFGTEEDYYGSVNDLCHLASALDASDGPKPRLYQCCGTDDPLTYEHNRIFRTYVEENARNLDWTYSEGPGGHDWAYWMPEAAKFVASLGLRAVC